MAREHLMSWEGPPNFRWVKMHKGVRHRVTCEELQAPVNTKEGSARLANDWWRRRVAELAGPTPTRRILDEVGRVPVETLAEMIARGQAARRIVEQGPLGGADVEEMIGIGPVEDEGLRAELLARVVAPVLGGAVRHDRTARHNVDEFVATRRDQARSGSRSADGADNIRIALEHWVRFLGERQPIDAVTAALWDRWYDHCRAEIAAREGDAGGKAGWSADYAQKVFGVSKTWVRWLYETERLDALPRTFGAKRHKFERPDEEPVFFSRDEVGVLLRAAAGQHRLHLLLMLNCGMTQKDISDLRKTQIDLERGYIARRRSKTRRQRRTPRVRYKLWPETLDLLRVHLSGDPVLALVTKTGRAWVRKGLDQSGRLRKSDNVATLFQRLRGRAGVTGAGKSLKVFRKTAASRLMRSLKYRDLRHYFLGHSPQTVADRHYSAESQRLLSRATDWLRESLRVADALASEAGPAASDPRGG